MHLERFFGIVVTCILLGELDFIINSLRPNILDVIEFQNLFKVNKCRFEFS